MSLVCAPALADGQTNQLGAGATAAGGGDKLREQAGKIAEDTKGKKDDQKVMVDVDGDGKPETEMTVKKAKEVAATKLAQATKFDSADLKSADNAKLVSDEPEGGGSNAGAGKSASKGSGPEQPSNPGAKNSHPEIADKSDAMKEGWNFDDNYKGQSAEYQQQLKDLKASEGQRGKIAAMEGSSRITESGEKLPYSETTYDPKDGSYTHWYGNKDAGGNYIGEEMQGYNRSEE
ncbi:hypothetical protein K2X33_13295, partial [bacterium]|nr:hypothetical protein [bacterium]